MLDATASGTSPRSSRPTSGACARADAPRGATAITYRREATQRARSRRVEGACPRANQSPPFMGRRHAPGRRGSSGRALLGAYRHLARRSAVPQSMSHLD